VAEDDLVVVIIDTPQRDEPAPLDLRSRRIAGYFERLRVDVDAGLRVLLQHTFRLPLLERGRRARVNILSAIVARLGLAKNDAHQVVRAVLVILLLHRGADLVVRLRQDVVSRDLIQVVAESAKRKYVCHRKPLINHRDTEAQRKSMSENGIA
jgi:hypothetical protein